MSNNNFDLKAPYEPSGDQPGAIEKLVDGLSCGNKFQTILGVTGSGKTYTMAQVIARSGRPAIVMAPNKTLAAQLYSEFRDFFPNNAVEYFVSYYDYYQPEAYVPSRDLFIEKDSAINEHIEQMRLSATKSLLERKDVILVATVSAIYGLGDPKSYHEMILAVRVGDKVSRKDIVTKLIKMQYSRTDLDFQRGTFRVRGDTIDIFPSEHFKEAVRIELFDDEVESIKLLDSLTGQQIKVVSRFSVYPASHYVATDGSIKKALDTVKKELKERLAELKNSGKAVEAQRLETRTNFDLEMLEEIGFCKGIENYSWHISGKTPGDPPSTLFDYLPKDSILFVDESHITIPQVGAMYKGDRARKENLVNFGFRLPSALDNRPLRFDEFESGLPQTIFVSATPADYEKKHQNAVVELVIRPTGIVDPDIEVLPAKTQIDDLLGQIKLTIDGGMRVLVTSLTKKMSEQITEYLSGYKIKTRYLHSDIDNVERVEILRDLRKGVFDVLVGINLLREGLDLPEVGLVAILDADKEGFLRSERSLIQTIGRAARNPKGRVILYADKVTESMRKAMDETERRRVKQRAYNVEHGITPKSATNQIKEIIDGAISDKASKESKKADSKKAGLRLPELMSADEIAKHITMLEKQMIQAAKELKFEQAAGVRDQIQILKEMLIKSG